MAVVSPPSHLLEEHSFSKSTLELFLISHIGYDQYETAGALGVISLNSLESRLDDFLNSGVLCKPCASLSGAIQPAPSFIREYLYCFVEKRCLRLDLLERAKNASGH